MIPTLIATVADPRNRAGYRYLGGGILSLQRGGEFGRQPSGERQGCLQPVEQPAGLVGIVDHAACAIVGRHPVPRQQRFQLVRFGPSGDDTLQDIGEPGHRINAIQLRRLDQRHRHRMTGPAIRTGEQRVFARQRHCGVILPISGKKWLCITDGIRFMAAASVGSTGERRSAGEVAHIETAPGVITVIAAWMLDPVACAGMDIGPARARADASPPTAPSPALLRPLAEYEAAIGGGF